MGRFDNNDQGISIEAPVVTLHVAAEANPCSPMSRASASQCTATPLCRPTPLLGRWADHGWDELAQATFEKVGEAAVAGAARGFGGYGASAYSPSSMDQLGGKMRLQAAQGAEASLYAAAKPPAAVASEDAVAEDAEGHSDVGQTAPGSPLRQHTEQSNAFSRQTTEGEAAPAVAPPAAVVPRTAGGASLLMEYVASQQQQHLAAAATGAPVAAAAPAAAVAVAASPAAPAVAVATSPAASPAEAQPRRGYPAVALPGGLMEETVRNIIDVAALQRSEQQQQQQQQQQQAHAYHPHAPQVQQQQQIQQQQQPHAYHGPVGYHGHPQPGWQHYAPQQPQPQPQHAGVPYRPLPGPPPAHYAPPQHHHQQHQQHQQPQPAWQHQPYAQQPQPQPQPQAWQPQPPMPPQQPAYYGGYSGGYAPAPPVPAPGPAPFNYHQASTAEVLSAVHRYGGSGDYGHGGHGGFPGALAAGHPAHATAAGPHAERPAQMSRFPPPPPPPASLAKAILDESGASRIYEEIALRWLRKVRASEPMHRGVQPAPEADLATRSVERWMAVCAEWWKLHYAHREGRRTNPHAATHHHGGSAGAGAGQGPSAKQGGGAAAGSSNGGSHHRRQQAPHGRRA